MPWSILRSERDPKAETLIMVFGNGSQMLEMVADFAIEERVVTLSGLHLTGNGPNSIGPAGMRALALWVKKEFGLDELRIHGASRTTGASPGRRPRPLVF